MQKVTPTGRGWMCPNAGVGALNPPGRATDGAGRCARISAFAKRKTLKVKHSEASAPTILGKVYHYRLVGNPVGLGALNGCEVQLAYDPLDLGEGALYSYDNQFVGLVQCVALRRQGEDGFVEDERSAARIPARDEQGNCGCPSVPAPMVSTEERLLRRRAVTPGSARRQSG